MLLFGIRVVCQLRALSRLHDREDDQGNEGSDELRERGVDVEDAKIDAGQLACRRVGVFWAVAVLDAQERRRRGCGGSGEFE